MLQFFQDCFLKSFKMLKLLVIVVVAWVIYTNGKPIDSHDYFGAVSRAYTDSLLKTVFDNARGRFPVDILCWFIDKSNIVFIITFLINADLAIADQLRYKEDKERAEALNSPGYNRTAQVDGGAKPPVKDRGIASPTPPSSVSNHLLPPSKTILKK